MKEGNEKRKRRWRQMKQEENTRDNEKFQERKNHGKPNPAKEGLGPNTMHTERGMILSNGWSSRKGNPFDSLAGRVVLPLAVLGRDAGPWPRKRNPGTGFNLASDTSNKATLCHCCLLFLMIRAKLRTKHTVDNTGRGVNVKNPNVTSILPWKVRQT